MKVKVKKISESAVPNFKSGNWNDYKLGEDNPDVSLPIDYEIEGEMMGEIKPMNSLMIARTKRNGVVATGIFCSSLIDKVTQVGANSILAETQNSVYLVEEIYES